MRKYGLDNFEMQLVKTCYTESQMYSAEIFFIKKYQTNKRDYGYNNSTGGEVSSKGMKHSEETKRKISQLQKGNRTANSGSFKKGCTFTVTPETRQKLSEWQRGRIFTDEHKAKISAAHLGTKRGPRPDDVKEKISAGHKGKKLSPEHCLNMSKARTGKTIKKRDAPMSEEHRKKISDSKRGVSPSAESVQKRAASIKKWWENKKKLNVDK